MLKPSVPSWSYLASYDYGTPILGTLHGSDIIQVFDGTVPDYASRSIRSYYFNFLYNLDPNVGSSSYPSWPRWSVGQQLVQFNSSTSGLIQDNFRQSSYNFLVANEASLHI